jgi:hypothetical protein
MPGSASGKINPTGNEVSVKASLLFLPAAIVLLAAAAIAVATAAQTPNGPQSADAVPPWARATASTKASPRPCPIDFSL